MLFVKNRLIILFLFCAVTVAAQNVYTYPDTVYVKDLKGTISMDDYLLNLVAEQSRQLQENDSLFQLAMQEQHRLDSIRQDSILLDSLKSINKDITLLPPSVARLAVKKSWIKDAEADREDVLIAIRDYKSPWRKGATVMVQMTQNFVTKNWYQGGNTNFSMLGIAQGFINYQSNRFTWQNQGEWRGGFSTSSGDTCHKVNTAEDYFRLYSKAGYEFHEEMHVIVSAEYLMNLLPTYQENSTLMKTAFASPIRFNVGIGVDFRPVRGLSIVINPIAYKLVYVQDTINTNPNDFGVQTGSNILSELGSSMRVDYIWKPVREFMLETRFYTYTNYHRVEVDLELNANFIINRFLSARLTLHPRYDNTIILDGDEKAKLQFKELLSIGFTHQFR